MLVMMPPPCPERARQPKAAGVHTSGAGRLGPVSVLAFTYWLNAIRPAHGPLCEFLRSF